jgi:mRNA-degrading endonuclease RelE of RelBE toxin-antitoxin system
MKVFFTSSARKSLRRIPADRRLQIVSRIEALASGTGQRGDVQRLAGSDLLRVGDYRVLFAVDTVNQILRVELIRTRGDVYKR